MAGDGWVAWPGAGEVMRLTLSPDAGRPVVRAHALQGGYWLGLGLVRRSVHYGM